jgi:hypothetical protein
MVEERKLVCWDKMVTMLSGEVKSLRRRFFWGDYTTDLLEVWI